MAIRKQAGFTLIELVLVFAISGGMMVIAFAGQANLRRRAAFDASVDKLVATIADAHNQATAGVNTVGAGNGTSVPCPGPGAANPYVFAGVSWTIADNPGPGTSTITRDYYKASRPDVACTFQPTVTLTMPSAVRMSLVAGGPAGQTERVLFVRDLGGGLKTCVITNGSANNVLKSYEDGDCSPPAVATGVVAIYLYDSDGHTSQVDMDQSGLAKRVK